MAYDKIVDSSALDANLTSVAEAIREKAGTTETLVFPEGFVEAVDSIELIGTLYEGNYAVIPKVTSQTLPTKDRHMVEDVEIKEIPYYDTSNNSGGTTVYIADSIDGSEPEDTTPTVSDDGLGNVTIHGIKGYYDGIGNLAVTI